VESPSREEQGSEARGGISVLTDDSRRTADELLELLRGYRGFIVPNAELQSWLTELGVPKKDAVSWLDGVLQRMGSDPAEPSYMMAHAGDVWEFIRKIRLWTTAPIARACPRDPRWVNRVPSRLAATRWRNVADSVQPADPLFPVSEPGKRRRVEKTLATQRKRLSMAAMKAPSSGGRGPRLVCFRTNDRCFARTRTDSHHRCS
jgi:hypothetical protein